MRKLALSVTAAAALSFAVVAHGQDSFSFNYPDPNQVVALDTDLAVKVRWWRGSRPVISGTVQLATTLGVIQDEIVTTNSSGIATFSIKSLTAGAATLTATTPGTDPLNSATVSIEFSGSVIAAEPFGEFAVQRTASGQLPLWMFVDRIGFRAQGSVSVADVAEIAGSEGLTQLTPLTDNVFVLKVDHIPTNEDAELFLRKLARRLEVEREEVASAGRVARLIGTNQWFIVPDEVIAKFPDGQDSGRTDELINEFNPVGYKRAPLDVNRIVIKLRDDGSDSIAASESLSAIRDEVVYAEPNYVLVFDIRADPSTDEEFQNQWHHENDGTYATDDADVDSVGAWKHGWGSDDVTIAVIDRGFDVTHPDLIDNLTCDITEWCGSLGTRAISVVPLEPGLLSTSGVPKYFAHGTRAAGVAAERGGNTIGYSGACPLCRLMLIRTEQNVDIVANAFDQAIAKNVDVISNSWGGVMGDVGAEPIKSIIDRIDTAVAAGITVVFAMSNEIVDNCGDQPDISSLPNVIGVNGITDYDRRSEYFEEGLAIGTCVDVMAPTRGGVRGMRTTSVKKNTAGIVESTYWHDFGGSSASTPLVAGIIGLMLSQDENLTPLEVQRILQDTADRADDKEGKYSAEFGFSSPSGVDALPTHGYGRVNAREAVRLVTPVVMSADSDFIPGLGKKDLLLRDHGLDWGNTERPSSVIFNSPREEYTGHQSVDIKIDVEPFKLSIPTSGSYTPDDFAELQSEDPETGKRMRVYVRLRNRGPDTINAAKLKLHVAKVTAAFPDLPGDFWDAFPNDSTNTANWQPIAAKDLSSIGYSGASLAGCPARTVPECLPAMDVDRAVVTMFPLGAQSWDPGAGERLALLAVTHSDEDPLRKKVLPPPSENFSNVLTAVSLDNNVTIWAAQVGGTPPICDDETLIIIIILVITLILILSYIIWRWVNGWPVPIRVWVVLVMVIVIIIVITVDSPGCFAQLPDVAVSPLKNALS